MLRWDGLSPDQNRGENQVDGIAGVSHPGNHKETERVKRMWFDKDGLVHLAQKIAYPAV